MAPRQTCSGCNSSSQKPGVYVDHDDIAPTFGDLVGFKHARGEHKVFVNSFSASAPAHPFLPSFHQAIVDNHAKLLYTDFSCPVREEFHNYTTVEKPNAIAPALYHGGR